MIDARGGLLLLVCHTCKASPAEKVLGLLCGAGYLVSAHSYCNLGSL